MNFTKVAIVALLIIAVLNVFTGLAGFIFLHNIVSPIIDLCFAVFFAYLAHTLAVRVGWPKFLAKL